jgi:hypothetical protein
MLGNSLLVQWLYLRPVAAHVAAALLVPWQ